MTPGLVSGCSAFDECAPLTSADQMALPALLSQTGLFAPGSQEIAADVHPYAPAFELWSDGAVKRRWIALPPGGVIDTSDMDDWRFPRGTRLWKEFTRDGVRVETRFLLKTGAGDADWVGAAYLWSGGEASLAIAGAADALGTKHDVPAADRCFGCHAGRRSRVLGFSAVQLANSSGPLGLRAAFDQKLLSTAPPGLLALPGSGLEPRVLGLFYANCAHCHNPQRPASLGPRCFDPENDIDLSLSVSALGSFAQTGLARTVIGRYVKPGEASGSKLFSLYTHRGPPGLFGPSQMPPLATEEVDPAGADLLRRWIEALPQD